MKNTIMSQSPKENIQASVKERIVSTHRSQWIKFAIVAVLYILFVIWDNNYWLMFGLILIFDMYISKIIRWDAWKNSKNKFLRVLADWADAIIFALVAVYIINIFIFQMYKIPTPSLEKSLLVGDYLLVDKVTYGPRVPNTPLAFPLTHHTLPIFNTKSYSNWPYWSYKRLKGFRNIYRNDIVVFNFPTGDSVALNRQNEDYYHLINMYGRTRVHTDVRNFGKIVSRPVDRRENYVKRCVGIPGDSLQIIDNRIYINGFTLPDPPKVQFNYYVETNGNKLTDKQFRRLDVSQNDQQQLLNRALNPESIFQFLGIQANENGTYNPVYELPLTQDAYDLLQRSGWAKSIRIQSDVFGENTYPYDYPTGWTRDNFGPIWIPKKGETILLNDFNLAMYSRCIINYEGNTLQKDGNHVFINGIPSNSYTFKYNYYFMMGDNRHNSLDSRYWGFVPEDHVVGKPLLVWMSIDQDRGWFDGKIRWKRLFRLAK